MTGARLSTLATLRGSIERIEMHGAASALDRVALGHAGVDATLQGGLARAPCMKCSPRAGTAARPPDSSRG